MNVISNTSPLCSLLLIDQVSLLPALFGELFIPEAVSIELRDKGAPEAIRQWMDPPPTWLKIVPVSAKSDPMLSHLHRGEQEAILLGEQISADLLLLDEKAARRAAIERGFNVTGLLGILDRAATVRLIDLPTVLSRLNQTNFRIAPRLLKIVLDKHYPELE